MKSALVILAVCSTLLQAQAGRGGRGGPPPTAKASAPIDLTGYWTAVITEDWHVRMLTAPRRTQLAFDPLQGAFDDASRCWRIQPYRFVSSSPKTWAYECIAAKGGVSPNEGILGKEEKSCEEGLGYALNSFSALNQSSSGEPSGQPLSRHNA
jgi:hypothetical protein